MMTYTKGETSFLELTHDKPCEVLSVEKGWYRVVDDSREDYLYPPEEFQVVEGESPEESEPLAKM